VTDLLEIDGLAVELPVDGLMRSVLHDATFSVDAGEAVALVGESGSGKSMTLRALLGLLPRGAVVHGDIRFDGASVLELKGAQMRRFLAEDIGTIFQDPRAHINPMRSVGDFLCEGLVSTRGVKRKVAVGRAVEALRAVRVADAERRMRQRPYELSGGLLQRVMIAAALIGDPRLLLADEPTTALDVTTQEEVMAILDELRRERSLAMIFVTHDLELAIAVCDRIAVMYAGSIVEVRPSTEIHEKAAHPYTQALLSARPSLATRGRRMEAIQGRPLSAFEVPDGCSFAPRCPYAVDLCRQEAPGMHSVGGGCARCHFAERFATGTWVTEAEGV